MLVRDARCVCKLYNLILASLIWLSFLLALLFGTLMTFTASCGFFVVVLCDLSPKDVDALLAKALGLQDELDIASLGIFAIEHNTTAADICSDTDDLQLSSYYMLSGGLVTIVSQVVMLVSYNVVAEVSWRHLKDKRKGETTELVQDPSEIRRQQMANSGYGNAGVPFSDNYAASGAPPSFGGPGCGPPSFGPGGGYSPGYGSGKFSAPSPVAQQGSSFGYNGPTTQDI